MEDFIEIELPNNLYLELERLKYEYTATKNIIDYILENKKYNQFEIFEDLLVQAQNKKFALQTLEDSLKRVFCPNEFLDQQLNYEAEINYDTSKIIYKKIIA